MPQRGQRAAHRSRSLLRQLRLRHEDLRLGQQGYSELLFPGQSLRFSNDPGLFESEVERAFPSQIDGLVALSRGVEAFPLDESEVEFQSARALLESYFDEPLLIEMLMLPVCYYGSAREDDIDWRQFVILFRSIFLEGFSRPDGGIRTMLNLIVKRYKSLGGELRTRSGVKRILIEKGRARGVELENGEELSCEHLLSSAGYVETMAMCPGVEAPKPSDVGQLSFVESISILDSMPRDIGHGAATSFFCTEERLRYRRPDELVDFASGVASSPNNFAAENPPDEGCMRLTILANHRRWCDLSAEQYAAAKLRLADEAIGHAAALLPDWRPHTVFRDVFTPRTIEHFTGHRNGAVYGSPTKRPTGETEVRGLFLLGTDQGYLGVVGAMMSGVAMANRHALHPSQNAISVALN